MGRSMIAIYSLIVCFCSLMCLMIVLGFGIYDVVRIAAPEFTVVDQFSLQTDEQYLVYYPDKKTLPAAELAQLRRDQHLATIRYERHAALQRLVWVLIIGVIDAVVYALHWRLASSPLREQGSPAS